MTLPLTPEELKQYNNVPTTPLSQKLGDTIDQLVAGNAYQVADMAARNALTPTDRQVVRVASTGELFVYDASVPQWRNVPNSSTRPDFFVPLTNFADLPDSPTIFVATTGSDVDGEGTQAAPFASVQRALESIPENYKAYVYIAVAPGTYGAEEFSWKAPSGTGQISVRGQLASAGEVISLTAANFPATPVPHPSGLGNYNAFRSFNSFPTWSTPIPGNFPTVYPVFQQGDPPEYMLLTGDFLNSGAFYQSLFSSGSWVVLPGSNNATGDMRLLATSLFTEGDYYLVNRSAFPYFPSLSAVEGSFSVDGNPTFFVNNIRAENVRARFTTFAGCFFEDRFFSHTMQDVRISSCVFTKRASASSAGLRLAGGRGLSGFASSYMSSGTLKIEFGAGAFVDRCIFDTTISPLRKLVVGGIFDTNDAAAGDSASISYTGYVDFIGDGEGIRLGSASVSPYNTITFDGVSNPLILTCGSTWGRRGGTALGTSTGPTIIGLNSSTGSSDAANPSGTGVSGWTITNTSVAGEEVKVGNNLVTTYASLPQTDFALGNTSLGAVGR